MNIYVDISMILLHLGVTTIIGIVITIDEEEELEMFHIINPKMIYLFTILITMS